MVWPSKQAEPGYRYRLWSDLSITAGRHWEKGDHEKNVEYFSIVFMMFR